MPAAHRNGATVPAVLLALSLLLPACREQIESGPPVVEVPADPWVVAKATDADGASLFASCASCHMADGSGRPDGSIPRLAGQREEILVHKLEKLRRGETFLPVMIPFARSLTDDEVRMVARYANQLGSETTEVAAGEAAATFRSLCAACHGFAAEGNDGLHAPRLCGQHAAYLLRRMAEGAANARGDADPAMAAIVASLTREQRQAIAAWLAGGACAPEAGS